MSQLDDIFKNGLGDKGIPYQDKYWQDLQKVLGKKNTSVFVRFKRYLLLLLLFSVPSIGFYCLYFGNNNSQTVNRFLPNESTVVIQNESEKTTATHAIQGKTADGTSALKKTSENNSSAKNRRVPVQKKKSDDGNGLLTEVKAATGDAISLQNSTAIPTSLYGEIASPSFLKMRQYFAFNYKLNTGEIVGPITPMGIPHKKVQWYLGGYAHVVAPQLVIAENINKPNERPNKSVNMGLQLLAKRNHWVFKTGFGMSRLNITTNYLLQNTSYEFDTTLRVINGNYTTTPRGSRVALMSKVVDTVSTSIVSENTCQNCEASFTYLNIPLAIQYEIRQQKLLYFAEMGINFNLLYRAKGLYATAYNQPDKVGLADYQVQEITNKHTSLNTMFLQANAGLGIKYKLRSNLLVSTAYQFQFGLNSMLHTYTQKIYTHGIQVGLAYRFY